MNGPNRPTRSAPLISRPQHSQPPQGQPYQQPSQLGNAIAGALGSMGMGMGFQPQQQQQFWGSGLPARPSNQLNHPLPNNPYAPQQQYTHAMQPFPQWGSPPSYPSYPGPPQNIAPAPQQFYPSLPQFFQQQAYGSANPLPPQLRTTAEGYTISESYVSPPPLAPSNRFLQNRPPSGPRQENGSGQRDGRGRGPSNHASRGGGSGMEPAPSSNATKCRKDGCTFQGSQKMVKEHEEDRHLMYSPGKEPKPWVPSAKSQGARIEGTNLSLDSPEAIAKWIAERKQKWPSSKVVDEKKKLRAERIAAGVEAPGRTRGGGRGGRGRGERGGRGNRGRGRGGVDSGWNSRMDDGGPPAKKLKTSDASSSNSDASSSSESDSEDDDSDAPPVASSSKLPVLPFDDDPPSRGPSIHPSRAEAANTEDEESHTSAPKKEYQVVCKQWRKGSCALGIECPYLHFLPPNSSAPPTRKRNRPTPAGPTRNPFARVDPFSQLAERDISRVVSEVLYVLEFLRKNDWLRGVETRVGQLDEEGGIEELEVMSSAAARNDIEGGLAEAHTSKCMIEEIKVRLLQEEDESLDGPDDDNQSEFDEGADTREAVIGMEDEYDDNHRSQTEEREDEVLGVGGSPADVVLVDAEIIKEVIPVEVDADTGLKLISAS